MITRKTLIVVGLLFVLSLLAPPMSAQAVIYTWSPSLTSGTWSTVANWNNSPPVGGPSGTANTATISNTTSTTVQLTNVISALGTLNLGGTATATQNVNNLNITSTGSLHANTLHLYGGSITGSGSLTGSIAISGYGVISAPITGTANITANATDGTNFGGFSPFVNGTPGTPLTLVNQSFTNGSLVVSGHGDFNLKGVTLNGTTLNGVSTNLNAGGAGGNNYYGLFSVTGDSTFQNTINNANYEQVNITGSTLHLNHFSLVNSWKTNVPAFFVVGAGGTLDNTVGNSTLNGYMSNILQGGAITNSGGGTFSSAGVITGYGSVSGPMTINGGLTASGGMLTVDGTAGAGIAIGGTSWQTGGGANDVLHLKGNFNYGGTEGFLNPAGAVVQLDGASLNTVGGTGTIYGGHGQINVINGVSTLKGAYIPNGSDGTSASLTIKNRAGLSLQYSGSLLPLLSMPKTSRWNKGPHCPRRPTIKFNSRAISPSSRPTRSTPGQTPVLAASARI